MSNDEQLDLRDTNPLFFDQIVGQRHVVQALKIACEASLREGKRADELLLTGPPGVGKSALVACWAHALHVPMTEILAQSITNAAELNSVLMSAEAGVLFLDELHLLHPVQQHALLQVLDKRRIFVSSGRCVQSIPVAPFTLVGATTDPDGLLDALISRFRLHLHLDFFSEDELAEIVRRRCQALAWDLEPELMAEIGKRARGTPRMALRLLQSARRVQVAEDGGRLTVEHLRRACEIERISDLGLDNVQQKYLALLGSGPQRLNVLASMLGVAPKMLMKTVEPYLLRQGLTTKTDAGLRCLTEIGQRHLSDLRPATA